MLFEDLKLQINGIDDEHATKLVDKIVELLGRFNDLDLRRLDSIIVTENFERDIESLTSQKNSQFKNRYISRKKTLAKVLTLSTEDDFKMVLIMRANYAKTLLGLDNEMSYNDAIHVFNHELGHVHDNNNKIDKFKKQMKEGSYKGKDAILYPIAEVCWSEYIANFLSSQSAQDSILPEMVANNFELEIRQREQNIKTEIMVFRTNQTRTDLLQSMRDDVEGLLKSASYLIGYMHGMQKSLEELSYDTDYVVETSYFKDIWEVLNYEFNSMLDVYPNGWMNLNIYKNLAFAIEAFFNQMGIVLMENDDGEVYFKVM